MASTITSPFPSPNIPVAPLPQPAAGTSSLTTTTRSIPTVLPNSPTPPSTDFQPPFEGSPEEASPRPNPETQSADTDFAPEITGEITERTTEPADRGRTESGAEEEETGERSADAETGERFSWSNDLTEEEIQRVLQLRAQDRLVRQHELAHLAAGGHYITGGPTFAYEIGPDGRRYATSGEVSIDASKEASPEETLAKAQIIRRAALAPVNPSSQDRAVAAAANRLEAQARREIAEQRIEETRQARDAAEEVDTPAPAESEFEFTEIGFVSSTDDVEEKASEEQGKETFTPISSFPVPVPSSAQIEIGQLIDFTG